MSTCYGTTNGKVEDLGDVEDLLQQIRVLETGVTEQDDPEDSP